MDAFDVYFYLLSELAGVLAHYAAISIALGLGIAFTTLVGRPWRRAGGRRALLGCLSLVGFPLAILAVGVGFSFKGTPAEAGHADTLPIALVYGLLALQGVAILALLVKSPGLRLRLLPSLAASVWISFWALFLAGIAISGVGP